jgi:hypothetical protein
MINVRVVILCSTFTRTLQAMHGGKDFFAICKFPQLHAGKKHGKAGLEIVRRIIPREDKTA